MRLRAEALPRPQDPCQCACGVHADPCHVRQRAIVRRRQGTDLLLQICCLLSRHLETLGTTVACCHTLQLKGHGGGNRIKLHRLEAGGTRQARKIALVVGVELEQHWWN